MEASQGVQARHRRSNKRTETGLAFGFAQSARLSVLCPSQKQHAFSKKKKKSQKQRTGAGEGTDAVFLCPVLTPDPTGVSTVALEQE
jgi:hypothetical protein